MTHRCVECERPVATYELACGQWICDDCWPEWQPECELCAEDDLADWCVYSGYETTPANEGISDADPGL